jgi:Cu+-exporting ATPase
VERAIKSVPGVEEVTLFLSSRKASAVYDPAKTSAAEICKAVERGGYAIESPEKEATAVSPLAGFSRRIITFFGGIFGAVLFMVVTGEWLGLFGSLTKRMPWPFWLAVAIAGGWPVLVKVVKAAIKGRVTSHTLMTIGMLAAMVVGEWGSGLPP